MTAYTLESISKMAAQLQAERYNSERPARTFNSTPLEHQLIAIRCQIRAQQWFDRNIAPIQALLLEMESQDRNIYLLMKEGAPEAEEMNHAHEKAKIECKVVLSSRFKELATKRKAYHDEGLSTPEYRACFGTICGRLETFSDVAMSNGRVDLNTVTTAHYKRVEGMILDEMGLSEVEEAEAEPGECPGYTKAIDTQADLYAARRIGDASEPDTDDLLKAEFVKMDELNAKLAKLA